jgi:hypothetical protein
MMVFHRPRRNRGRLFAMIVLIALLSAVAQVAG